MIALIDKFNQVSMGEPSQDIIDIYKHIPEINELDNRAEPICRPLFSHSSLPDVLELQQVETKKFKFDKPFSYFVHVHHNQPLWAKNLDIIPTKILEEVRKGNCKLIFDNTLEGRRIDGKHFLNPFYKSIDDLKLPTKNIYFITNDLIAEKTHSNYDRKDKVNVISIMWNVFDVKRLIHEGHLPSRVNIENEIKYKSKNNIKHFLKVNRTNRFERNLFMLFMNHHKLLDKSLISFPSFPKESYPSLFDEYTTDKNIKELMSKVPFDIDETDETNHGPAGVGEGKFNADLPFNPIHYRNSFISIVMCAFPFDINGYHLHSSTFNPIYCGHPIIQFGPYESLKVMRDYGFKTFDKWWDESYDEERDDYLRLKKIMDIVLNVSKLSQNELINIYKEMKETLQHNVDVVKSYDMKSKLYDRIVK